MTQRSELIRLEQLCFSYHGTEQLVLDHLDLVIEQQDYVAILGTSGSGKSTLLSVLGLVNPPGQGHYFLLGHDVRQLTDKSVALLKNREIGFIFQNFNLLNHLSVYQNLCVPLSYNSDIPRSMYREKAEQVLQQVGMLQFSDRLPSQLSGGQQQRVAIARAIINNPSLILADEPSGNLDSATAELIFDILQQLNDAGKTICLITHDVGFATKAKRVLRLSDGRFISNG
jgi:putative ABC transport system ATP-binding protein